ncbi:metal-dependent hydrolase [Azohydromonas lata]|uniref:metal-dependent hydrolase n=1 Tax=Azohydromonas lata TaxID=45677 RepID=UPI00082C1ABE|nr:metal-dependent hydrolase [Azohydromonas lata]
MASQRAHELTGWAAGIAAAAWVIRQGAVGPYHLWMLATVIAGYFGGTAPDWLEQIPWRKNKRWCTHRTITHWVPGWVALLYAANAGLGTYWFCAPLFGFAAGGLIHLLIDWPNPLGVPILWSRHSLKLWKSGHADSFVVAACWFAAIWIADKLLFDSLHFHRALAFFDWV